MNPMQDDSSPAKSSQSCEQTRQKISQFPSKVVVDLMAQKQTSAKRNNWRLNVDRHIRRWKELAGYKKLTHCLVFCKKRSVQILQKATCYYQFPLLWGVFFLIWHPGLYSRFIPKENPKANVFPTIIPARPDIYPLEKVYLQADIPRGLLSLYMENRQIACYPVRISLPKGKYSITNIIKDRDGHVVAQLTPLEFNTSEPIWISTIHQLERGQIKVPVFFIGMERDYWEMLYPYLRCGNIVYVESY